MMIVADICAEMEGVLTDRHDGQRCNSWSVGNFVMAPYPMALVSQPLTNSKTQNHTCMSMRGVPQGNKIMSDCICRSVATSK